MDPFDGCVYVFGMCVGYVFCCLFVFLFAVVFIIENYKGEEQDQVSYNWLISWLRKKQIPQWGMGDSTGCAYVFAILGWLWGAWLWGVPGH